MDYGRGIVIAKIRIIGGKWRGRKLFSPDVKELRPTTDRVRETVFNWLMQDVVGACCLDLYAGTGALGWEALSRGAQFVTFVEKDKKLSMQLKQHQVALDVTQTSKVYHQDSTIWLKKNINSRPFDIIFVDPPFSHDIYPILDSLNNKQYLQDQTLLYIEQGQALDVANLPGNWDIMKQKNTGQVHYYLVQNKEGVWKSS